MPRSVLVLVAGLLVAAGVLPGLHVRAQSAAFFSTGQSADLMLSGFGFNRTGGPLRFNHPGGLAVVGGRLALADRNNNRVLVWPSVPRSGSELPSLVLGQGSFDTNAPGSGLDGLNWPTAVASDGTRLYVADAYNSRVLVWRAAPTRTRQPADFALTAASGVAWPWGIWTDGRRLAVSATMGGRVLVWNSLPESDRRPDLELRIPEFGTPRTIESDGVRLLVSDHNARVGGSDGPGNFFWTTFPSSGGQAYDFFMKSAPSGPQAPQPQPSQGEHIHDAAVLPDGRLLAVFNRSLCLWPSFPRGANEACAVQIGAQGGAGGGFDVDAGDNSGIAIDDGRVLVSLNNGNRVVVWNSLPVASSQLPEFAIGSPDIRTNTLATDAIVTNAVPLTDGRRLWLSSDFDRKLHVWRELPRESGQKPDFTYSLDFGPWASTRYGAGVVLAGTNGTVAIWNTAPEGQSADTVLRGTIGGKTLGDLRGVAWDGASFYLASYDQGRVWVWRGVPTASSAPFAEIQITQPGRISADGRYLAVSSGAPGGAVYLYDVASLGSNPSPVRVGQGLGMNLPQGVTLASGGLFIADTNGNRVLAWREAADAAAGRNPDASLGSTDLRPRDPAIGQDTLFWPGAVAYDGSRLWVGEFKFSNRVLRFSRP